jgi:hypothetical protein
LTRYNIHPAEQQFREWDLENKRKRNEYWNMLRRARIDFNANECDNQTDASVGAFRYWMDRRWGLAIEIIDGNISGMYTVTDESKYLLFQMKYA